LEKTVFILELLLDPQLRHRQERGLNDGEAVNSASRAIFVGQRGEFRDRAYQDQVHRASCLHLLVAAIGAWTTPYLAQSQHPRHEVQGRHGRGHRGDERARAWQRMTAQAPGFAAYETSTDRQIPVIRLTTV
jgi:hypothetical protein